METLLKWDIRLEIIFIPVVIKKRTRYSDCLSTRLELNSLHPWEASRFSSY